MIDRTLSPAGTYDVDGWLQPGLSGHQPELVENYINVGSLYLCATAFLPLGLGVDAPFWKAPPAPWSQQAIWSGQGVAHADAAL